MNKILSFNLSIKDRELEDYVDNLSKDRQLSIVISNLLFEKMLNEKSNYFLKQELDTLEKNYKTKTKEISENIEKNEKNIKKLYDECFNDLKNHYSGKKRIKVDKFIEFNAKKISFLSGDKKEVIINKITSEIKKFKKEFKYE